MKLSEPNTLNSKYLLWKVSSCFDVCTWGDSKLPEQPYHVAVKMFITGPEKGPTCEHIHTICYLDEPQHVTNINKNLASKELHGKSWRTKYWSPLNCFVEYHVLMVQVRDVLIYTARFDKELWHGHLILKLNKQRSNKHKSNVIRLPASCDTCEYICTGTNIFRSL